MTQRTRNSEPIFNIKEMLPLYLAGIFTVVHIAVYYGPKWIEGLASQWLLLKSLNLPGQSIVTKISSLIGHGFIHGSWTHLLVNCGMLVVFGVVTIQGVKLHATAGGRSTTGTAAFLFIFFASVVVGGLGQWAQWAALGSVGSALGASGGVSGLFATAAWAMGGRKKLVQFGLGWLLLNVIFIFAGGLLNEGGIAWASHLAGYVGGAICAPLFVRPNSTGFSIKS